MGKDNDDLLAIFKANPQKVRFNELAKICETYFGKPRQLGTSHMVFKTPWPGDPRVNIQNDKERAKVYQVRQVLLAIEKLKGIKNAQ